MNDDKFLNKSDPFNKIEFDAEVDYGEEYHDLSEHEQSIIENEIEAQEREEREKWGKFGGEVDHGVKSQNEWFHFFNEVFLEIFDSEKSLDEIKEQYTTYLLERGIHVNPHEVYQSVEMINTRMSKLALSKRIAHAHGLFHEWPEILQKELELLYNAKTPQKTMEIHGRPVGERN